MSPTAPLANRQLIWHLYSAQAYGIFHGDLDMYFGYGMRSQAIHDDQVADTCAVCLNSALDAASLLGAGHSQRMNLRLSGTSTDNSRRWMGRPQPHVQHRHQEVSRVHADGRVRLEQHAGDGPGDLREDHWRQAPGDERRGPFPGDREPEGLRWLL
jgi:hypothetical protein